MMNKGASSNGIPMDLIYQILSKLPIRSIFRFLCVSKLWKSIICSQYFKELFYTMSSSKPRLLILVQHDDHRRFFSSPHPQLSSLVVPSEVGTKLSGHPYYCSYVSGLIYFPGFNHSIVCNPSTGQQVIRLPPDPECSGLLGYDPIGKQFKVLVYKAKHDDELVYHILTLGNENERWREIKCSLTYRPYLSEYICINGVCINGVLYYIAHKKDDGHVVVVGCFDVRYEKFKFLYDNDIIPYFTTLINYKDNLGGIQWKYCCHGGGTFLQITICVLEDVDKVEWKKYTYKVPENIAFEEIPPFGFSVVGVTVSGDIVLAKDFMHKDEPFYVLYYNPERNTVRCVEIKDVNEDKELLFNQSVKRFLYFVDHVENLGF